MSINERMENLGGKITVRVGTMWTALIFACLSLVSLPAVIRSGDPVLIVAWITQTFLQLVLLPVIMVGQAVQGRKTEQTIVDTHDLVVAEVQALQQLVAEHRAETLAIGGKVDEVHAKVHEPKPVKKTAAKKA